MHHRPTDSFFRPSVGTPSLPHPPVVTPCTLSPFPPLFEDECMHCRQRAFALGFSQLNLRLGIWVCEACDPKKFKP
jgi:hypothetical protein